LGESKSLTLHDYYERLVKYKPKYSAIVISGTNLSNQ